MNTNENEMSKGDREYDLACRVHFGEASEAERVELEGLLAASPELREQKAALAATAALVKGAYGRPTDGIGEQRLERVLSEVGSTGATIVPMKRTRLERPLEVAAVAAGLMAAAGLWIVLPGDSSNESSSSSMTSSLDSGSSAKDEAFWLARTSGTRDDTTTALGGFDPDATPPALGGFRPDAAIGGSVTGDGDQFMGDLGVEFRGLGQPGQPSLEGATTLGLDNGEVSAPVGDIGAFFGDGEARAGGEGGPGPVQLKGLEPRDHLAADASVVTVAEYERTQTIVERSSMGSPGAGGGTASTPPGPESKVANPAAHWSSEPADAGVPAPLASAPEGQSTPEAASYALRYLSPELNAEVGGGGGGNHTFGSLSSYGGTYRGPGDTTPPPSGGGGNGPPPPPPSSPGAPSAGFFLDDSKNGAFAATTQDFFEGKALAHLKHTSRFPWSAAHSVRYPHVKPTRIPNERPRDMFFRFWGDNPYVVTDVDALSTFAADVDTASFALAERMLTQGIRPTREQIRTEEFVNYLTPDLAAPDEAAFAIHSELSPSPFAPGKDRYLLRVGVRAKEVAKEERPPLALTFVVDVSGSMEKENRLELVKHAMRLLGSQLEAKDTISIVSFSNEAKLVLGATPADRADLIEGALFGMSPGGGTNADAGLALGYQVAAAQQAPGAQRRVVFLSDGVANIGETDQAKLSKRATEGSEQRIFLNTIGVGLENHNDVFLEQLANEGDGVCDYVADAKSARRAIVDRFTGGFVTVAKDAKIQVEFDTSMVLRWRQLGYENRAIADKDFRNDAVDAAEIGAGHQVTCLYEVELADREATPRTEEPALAMVRVRWQPIEGDSAGAFTEVEAPVNFLRDSKDSFRSASHGFRRAALAAQLAECLRASIHTAGDSVKELGLELAQLLSEDRHDDTARLAAMTKAAIDLGLVTRPALAASDPDSAHRRAYHEALIESLGGVIPRKTVTGNVQEASAEDDLEEQLREILRKRNQEKAR